MIEEELKGVDIDGSGKIIICAYQVQSVLGEDKYICDQYFNISVYYLEPEDVTKKLEGAFENIINNQFVREERISKLTKRAKNIGLTAYIYRILSDETGEGWYVKIADRKGNIYCQATISDDVRYVDRLGSRLYAKEEWHGNTFVILNRFGKDAFSISVKTKKMIYREKVLRPAKS